MIKMNKNWKVLFLIFWLVAVLDHTSGEQLEFEFDLDNVDDDQRDRLFEYLDQNDDKQIDRNEMKLLFRQLLRSSDNKSYVNESNEKSLFFALNFTESDKTVEKPEFNGLWNYWIKVILKPRSALIVVDMQNDFVDQKTGHVYVKGSEKIVPTINDLIQAVPFETVIYTYDWHRSDHCSFIENVRNEAITRQIVWSNKPLDQLQVGDSVRFAIHPQLEQQLWPYHCIRDSEGAKLYSDLIIADNSVKVGKGFDSEVDSYSGFKDNIGLHYTVLDGELQMRDITDIYMTGVTYDFCVGNTARDGLSLGYRTAMIEDAIQEVTDDGKYKMKKELKERAASFITSSQVMDMVKGKDRRLEMAIALANSKFKDQSSKQNLLESHDEL